MYFGWWFFCLVAGSTVYRPVARQKRDEKLWRKAANLKEAEGEKGWGWGRCTFTDLELRSLVSDSVWLPAHQVSLGRAPVEVHSYLARTSSSWDSVGICRTCAAWSKVFLVLMPLPISGPKPELRLYHSNLFFSNRPDLVVHELTYQRISPLINLVLHGPVSIVHCTWTFWGNISFLSPWLSAELCVTEQFSALTFILTCCRYSGFLLSWVPTCQLPAFLTPSAKLSIPAFFLSLDLNSQGMLLFFSCPPLPAFAVLVLTQGPHMF